MKREDPYEIIYTATIRHPNGRLLIAANYGLRAFRIKVRKHK